MGLPGKIVFGALGHIVSLLIWQTFCTTLLCIPLMWTGWEKVQAQGCPEGAPSAWGKPDSMALMQSGHISLELGEFLQRRLPRFGDT